jgi:hypothetical protein
MYGLRDLKSHIYITKTSVECPVLGCSQVVERQRRSFKRAEKFRCPEHRIYISPSTFEYDHETDNLLWKNAADLALLDRIKTVKRESRMRRDNSEDALSWNVFRYLETAQQLAPLLSWITQAEQKQAELIYWSYSQPAGDRWAPLNKARKEFGENIQRSSEPDLIALTENGLFFIEAKLTASNNTTPGSSHARQGYLAGGGEWWRQAFSSDYETVAIQARKYELFRFWLLGTWLAKQLDRKYTLINLVLSARQADIEERFTPHVRLSDGRCFKRVTWEGIGGYISENAPDDPPKRAFLAYLENKTTGYDRNGKIRPAFLQIIRKLGS